MSNMLEYLSRRRIPYRYKPLKEGEIRLLEVNPGGPTDMISCRLIHISLSNPGRYEAVSYTWGNENHDRMIDIDGASFHISPTLEDALKQFRLPGTGLWEKYLHLSELFDKLSMESHFKHKIETLSQLGQVGDQMKSEYEFITKFRELFLEYFNVDNEIGDGMEFGERNNINRPRWRTRDGKGWYEATMTGMERACQGMMLFLNATPNINIETRREARRMWIDAICINQADLKERSAQVSYMLDIYANTIRLVIWMGKESDNSELALSFMQAEWKNKAKNAKAGAQAFLNRLNENPFNIPAILSFFSRPWFERAWIVQEYVAGTDSDLNTKSLASIIVCGKVQVVTIAVLIFGHSSLEDCIAVAGDLPVESARKNGNRCTLLLSRYLKLMDIRKEPTHLHAERNSLLYWLYTIRGSNATDPRDKVYSALGLAKRRSGKEYDSNILIVDYSTDIQNIYSSLVKSIVAATKDLSVLSACAERGAEIGFTWIPDWTVRKNPLMFFFLSELDQTHTKSPIVAGTWDAAKGRASEVSFDGIPHTMTVRGMVIEAIDFIVRRPAMPHKNMSERERSGWKDFIMLLSYAEEHMYPTANSMKTAFWTTLLAGTPYLDHNGLKRLQKELSKLIVKRWRMINLLGFLLPESIRPNPLKLWENILGKWSTSWLLSQADKMKDDVDIFITEKKRHIGKCWQTGCVVEGDILCVLLGLRVPIVLRKVGNHYEIVSTVYVHGLMNGEAIDVLEDISGCYQLQDFELH